MKKWFEPLSTAWEGVRTHKLRSSLTILGIVIGVAAVITLMSIGRGTQAEILSRMQALGSNLIVIMPGRFAERGGVMSAAGSAANLTLEDAAAISEQVPHVTTVAPSSSARSQLIAGGKNTNASVIGVTPEYQQVYNLKTTEGAFISPSNYQDAANVAVIGTTVKDDLFSGVDPIGQQIRMGNSVVSVMGVLESKGASMMGSADDAILVPLTTLQQTISQRLTSTGEHVVNSVAITVSDQKQSDDVVNEITSLLRSRHQLAAGAADDFTIRSMEELIGTVTEMSNTMTNLLGAIAGISLLVGGIGVMNIMLVSVVERTREIGIRKALGARERNIWSQFLTESAFLSLSGGLIGVAAGWIVSHIVSSRGTPTLVSPDIIVLAVSVSIGIGLAFGFLPARRAANLNPIEALRYE